MKISVQDFEKYDFYEDDYGSFYAKQKDSRHKLFAKEGNTSWDILPFGSQREEYLDRAMYFGDGLSWINQIEKLPDWLPQLPIESEVKATKSISWSERLAENPIHHTFKKYKYIYDYFLKNKISELEVFLKFSTEEFDGFNTEPRYTLIDEVLLQKTNETTKSEVIFLFDNHFDIPKINAEYPGKYRVSDVLWNLDNSLFIDRFKIFKDDKRAFLQNKAKPEKIFEFVPAEKDWIPISVDDDMYSKIERIFSDDSIDFKQAVKLDRSEYSRLIYYKQYRLEYLT